MNIIKKGNGELFTDPDPDHARTFFQKKSRKMVNKSMTLTKAIETFVHDGEYLALGGSGQTGHQLRPVMKSLDKEGKIWVLPDTPPLMISRFSVREKSLIG